MKTTKATAILLLLLLGSVTATIAEAGPWRGGYHGGYHGGWHGPYVGIGVGVGLATWPLYYPYGYYPYGYYPYASYPPVVVTQTPTTYIQQGNTAPAPQQAPANDWYYCHNPAGYYPYVKSCPEGWQRVPAQPQTQN